MQRECIISAQDISALGSPSLTEAILVRDKRIMEQDGIVRLCFTQVPAPSAKSAAEVRRNCQTWCVGVLKRLIEKGSIEQRKVEEAMARLESVRGGTPIIS